MEKEIKISDQIKTALDGRTQKWLRERTGIDQATMSLIITGRLLPTQLHLDKINSVLKTGFRI